MAYVYDNKTYRNLQQQVKENMDNIAELQDLKLVGIAVKGIVPDYSSLPSSAEQGQVYAVGSASPYELYVYNNSSWVDFGEFPKAGPQGEQGPQGEPGRQGQRGLTGPQGPKGYTGAPGTPGNPGPEGPKGPKGDKGDMGLVEAFAKDSTSITAVGQAYVDEIGYLQVCTSLSPLTFEKGGYIKGPMGSKGIQGDQGPQGPKGDTGPQGPVGPQGPKGDPGKVPPDVATETYVNERHAASKDYADEQIARAAQEIISKIPTTDYKSDITMDSSNVLKTVYGGSHVVFKNAGYPGEIIGNTVDLSLPELTWGTHDTYTEYAYKDWTTVEACYKCWRAYIDAHNLNADATIDLELAYTDSTGSEIATTGTGVIHSNSFIDPSAPKHQIRLASVSFPHLNISNATFRIQPQYGQIFITGSQLLDSSSQPITNIKIGMYLFERNIYKPIDSNFIGYDIARLSDLPTTTGELTNDSGFITNEALTSYTTKSWVIAQGYQTASDVSATLSSYSTTSDMNTAISTAISSQTKETWTFTLSDGSTVTKTVVLG